MRVLWLGSLLASLIACSGNDRRQSQVTSSDAGVDAVDAPDAQITPPLLDAGFGEPCNTWPALCERRYNEIAFAASHAAMANQKPPWDFPAQQQSLRRQLDDGVRALLLEVHEFDGVPTLCFVDCAHGRRALTSALGEIAGFLADNRREVITLILENYVPATGLALALAEAKLDTFLHAQAPGVQWPTLAEMIATNQRLVAFVSDATQAPPGLLPIANFIWSTREDHHTAAELDCEAKHGSPSTRELGLVHHTLAIPPADDSDAGSEEPQAWPSLSQASEINHNPFLITRLRGCRALHDRLPNFVSADFYDVGDLVLAMHQLNGLAPDSD